MSFGYIWVKVSRKADCIREMRNICLSSAGLDTPCQSQNWYIKYDLEVTSQEWAASSWSNLQTNHEQALSGCALDISLPSVKDTCNTNYTQYKDNFFESGKFSGKQPSSCITHLKNRRKSGVLKIKSKAAIEKMIMGLMDIMPSTESASLFREAMKN